MTPAVAVVIQMNKINIISCHFIADLLIDAILLPPFSNTYIKFKDYFLEN